MITSEVKYLGNLRTACLHVQSGIEIITDAPVDNKGRGEAFSPTDLVATAYASCMITIMGIFCNEHAINFDHANAKVQKIMGTSPRRIERIVIELDLTGNNWSEDVVERVLRAGKACPVAKTLGDNVEVDFTFNF
jgi:putative redox protein